MWGAPLGDERKVSQAAHLSTPRPVACSGNGPQGQGQWKRVRKPKASAICLGLPSWEPCEARDGVGGPTPEGLSWVPREVGAEKPTGETELCSMGNLSRPGSTLGGVRVVILRPTSSYCLFFPLPGAAPTGLGRVRCAWALLTGCSGEQAVLANGSAPCGGILPCSQP